MNLIWMICAPIATGPTSAFGDASDGAIDQGGAETLAELTDSAKVFLIDRLPLGASANQLVRLAPFLEQKPWAWEGEVELFGMPAQFEANVIGECVYGYAFRLSAPASVGDSLFAHLDSLYTARWGAPSINDSGDSPYFVRGRSWCPDSLSIGVSCSLVGDWRQLGLGFQHVCAHDPRRRWWPCKGDG